MLVDGRYVLAVFCRTCLSYLCFMFLRSSDVYNTSRMGSVCVCVLVYVSMCMYVHATVHGDLWVGGGVCVGGVRRCHPELDPLGFARH